MIDRSPQACWIAPSAHVDWCRADDDAWVRLGIIAVDLQRPDTHWFWYVSRAAGISAYLALALSVIWGLLLSTRLVHVWIARGHSVELHKWISAVALALIVAHALLLTGDPYVRFDLLDICCLLLPPIARPLWA